MRRSLLLALTLTLAATPSSPREPTVEASTEPSRFRLDLSLPETVDALEVERIARLAVGDSTFVSAYSLCRRGGRLAVPVFARPSGRPDYTAGLELTRLETAVALSIVPAREAPERATDRLARLASTLMARPDCDALLADYGVADDAIDGQLWPVRTIDGETGLAALVDAAVRTLNTTDPAVAVDDTAADTAGDGGDGTTDDPVTALLDRVEELADDTEPRRPRRWSIRHETDDITDEPNIYITGWSTEPVPQIFGAERMRLVLRCQRNTSAVILPHGDYDHRDRITVFSRFDDEPADETRWRRSADGRAVGRWRGATAIPLMRRMVEHDRLRLRVMLDDRQLDLEFDLTGLRSHVEQLAEACNWSP